MTQTLLSVLRYALLLTVGALATALNPLLAQDDSQPANAAEAQEKPSTEVVREQKSTEVVKQDKSEPVFSGPQVGEKLPEVPVWLVASESKPDAQKPSTKVDLAKENEKQPVVIAFMHEKSRPAFQLGRVMSAFAETKQEQGLRLYFVVLTEDRSASEKWLTQIRGYLSKSTQFAVADGGLEGPGGLGLNRLVAMTILVAKDGKVTSNFALTQVTAASDGPEILKAMNEVSGGGEIPPMQKLMPRQGR